ncbi:MAG: membrane protein insertase YidC [Victivallaceae bacterium]|nr:membrane protein insertase YidC [Victivallaceae bacterium]
MKISKDILLAILISAGILFAWEPFCRWVGWLPEKPAARTTMIVRTAEPKPDATPSPALGIASPAAEAVPEKSEADTPRHENVSLENDLLRLSISPDDGMIGAATLLQCAKRDRKDAITIDQALRADRCGALAFAPKKHDWKSLGVLKSELHGNVYQLERRMQTAQGTPFVLSQTWTLGAGSYAIDYQVSVVNASSQPLSLSDVVVYGGDLLPWNDVSGDAARIPSHRLSYMTIEGDYDDIKADKKHAKFMLQNPPQVQWCAVGNKYFCSILASRTPFTLFQAQEWTSGAKPVPVIAAGADLGDINVAGHTVKSYSFRCYCGPKILDRLDDFSPSANRVMHLAWGPLDYLARLLLWLLVKMNALFHSYGISIIALTLIVRIVFYPVTAKANNSMKKMQLVQPKLKELRDKYKDNPQLMNAKMMELYRQEGVNPFGGCLPILFQIPIFFALYQMLDGAIQLRQESFLWCADLAQADTVARIPLYFTSLPLNPLVIAMTVLMLIQQKLTPAVGDPAQRKMMMIMPIAMLLFLYDLPSGLTLYWTVSNAFSIVQMQLQKRKSTAVTASAGK